MRTTFPASFILLVSLQCCFGQSNNDILAIGDWSEPVNMLRGRILVCKPAKVYLELQNLNAGYIDPMEFYLDCNTGLNFKISPIIETGVWSWNGPVRQPFIATLPTDSTLRIPADYMVGHEGPDGLVFWVPHDCGGPWKIPRGTTNDYFLSATFSPPTNHPSALNYRMWQGTLELPKVKIPASKTLKKP